MMRTSFRDISLIPRTMVTLVVVAVTMRRTRAGIAHRSRAVFLDGCWQRWRHGLKRHGVAVVSEMEGDGGADGGGEG